MRNHDPDAETMNPVRVRAIRSADAPALERFYAELSPESRLTRFLFISSGLSHAQSASFCTTDHGHREGFVAAVDDGPTNREQIVGHLCLEPDGEDGAEVAVAVADAFQNRGIGRRLLAAGAAWAARRGIGLLTATMAADNAPIYRLLAGLGLPTSTRYLGAGVSEVTIVLRVRSIAA